MDKSEQQILRGEEALRVINSQVFTEAFDQVREAYLRTWEALPTAEAKSAQDIHNRLKALGDVRKQLEAHIQTGKLAQKRLDKLVAMAGRLNPFATTGR